MSDIYLYVYDLSKGMAKQFSAMFLGKFSSKLFKLSFLALITRIIIQHFKLFSKANILMEFGIQVES